MECSVNILDSGIANDIPPSASPFVAYSGIRGVTPRPIPDVPICPSASTGRVSCTIENEASGRDGVTVVPFTGKFMKMAPVKKEEVDSRG